MVTPSTSGVADSCTLCVCADVPLSVGILDPRASPTQLNTVEFLWDPSKRASAFIQVRGVGGETARWGVCGGGGLPAGGYTGGGLPTGGYTGGGLPTGGTWLGGLPAGGYTGGGCPLGGTQEGGCPLGVTQEGAAPGGVCPCWVSQTSPCRHCWALPSAGGRGLQGVVWSAHNQSLLAMGLGKGWECFRILCAVCL